MILSLLSILCAMYWLLRETDYLRCNLMGDFQEPIQIIEPIKRQSILEPCAVKTMEYQQVDMTQPYWWLSSDEKDNLILCHNCRRKCDKERWIAYTLPERTIKFDGNTLNLAKQCNIKRAKILKEAYRELKRKTLSLKLAPYTGTLFTSSEYNPETGNNDIRKSNCLFPVEWLEAHYQDIIPEPTIELSVNGKEIHFNGNYKSGCIKEFCKANAEVWERPRKKQRMSKIEA